MKKFLCIFLSALLICALFIIPASAAEASLSYTLHRGRDYNLTSLNDIKSLPTTTLPVEYDGSAGSLGNAYFFELSLPSFVSINSLDVPRIGAQMLILYDSSDAVITTLNVGSMDTVDLSSYDNISSLVFKTSIGSGGSITSVTFHLDYVSPSVWNGISDFISGLFGAVGSIVSGVLAQPVILSFVILLPLIVISVGYLFKFLKKRRKRR